MSFYYSEKDKLKYIRADDMNQKFAVYFNKDAPEIIKQIYLDVLIHKNTDDISKTALEYTDAERQLGWTKIKRHITLTRMPYNAKHLITLQAFLLWTAKHAKDETKDNSKRKRVRRKPE